MAEIKAPEYRPRPAPVTEEAATLSPTEARQSVKLGTMRYVLGISTVATVVVFVIAYFIVR